MRMHLPVVIRLSCIVFFLAVLSAPGHALTPDQIFDKVKDSVVIVKSLDADGKAALQGSGVLISSDKIATNCHVLKGGVSYLVAHGNQLVPATLYSKDATKDICILTAKGVTGSPVQLGKSTDLKVGNPVYAVGAPYGLELSLSDGIVSQLRGGPPPFIQTTAAISPGSSGGGLFNADGRLVGLTTLRVEGGQALNFAMPVEWIGEIKPGHKVMTISTTSFRIVPSDWVKGAAALEEKKDWKGLLDWAKKWIANDSQDPLAWGALGKAYNILNRHTDAINAYRQAVAINPKYTLAWNALGVNYIAFKRYNDAIDSFRKALSIDPKYADAWHNIGIAYDLSNRYNDAIEAFRQALSIDPRYVMAWNGLGLAYRHLNQSNDAIEAFRRALSIDPKNADAWYNIGVTYGLGRANDAIDSFRKALNINPKNADAWFNIGICSRHLNRRNDAFVAFLETVNIDPKNAIAWYNIGVIFGEGNRHNDAIDSFRKALSIDPKYADAWYNIGIAYFLSGNRTASLNAVKELQRLDPERADRLLKLIEKR